MGVVPMWNCKFKINMIPNCLELRVPVVLVDVVELMCHFRYDFNFPLVCTGTCTGPLNYRLKMILDPQWDKLPGNGEVVAKRPSLIQTLSKLSSHLEVMLPKRLCLLQLPF